MEGRKTPELRKRPREEEEAQLQDALFDYICNHRSFKLFLVHGDVSSLAKVFWVQYEFIERRAKASNILKMSIRYKRTADGLSPISGNPIAFENGRYEFNVLCKNGSKPSQRGFKLEKIDEAHFKIVGILGDKKQKSNTNDVEVGASSSESCSSDEKDESEREEGEVMEKHPTPVLEEAALIIRTKEEQDIYEKALAMAVGSDSIRKEAILQVRKENEEKYKLEYKIWLKDTYKADIERNERTIAEAKIEVKKEIMEKQREKYFNKTDLDYVNMINNQIAIDASKTFYAEYGDKALEVLSAKIDLERKKAALHKELQEREKNGKKKEGDPAELMRRVFAEAEGKADHAKRSPLGN